MRTTHALAITAALCAILVSAQEAVAEGITLSAAEKCAITKMKATGKRAACLALASAKEAGYKNGRSYLCEDKFAAAFSKAESKATAAGDVCPTVSDAAIVAARVDAVFDPMNGVTAGMSGYRFHDNGDGTITDRQTGLMWEKKTGDGDIHWVAGLYDWSSDGSSIEEASDADGTLFTVFLAALNDCSRSTDGVSSSGGFAGYCDWRIPTLEELLTIRKPSPCEFHLGSCYYAEFSPTTSDVGELGYWTVTNSGPVPVLAWQISFTRDPPLDSSAWFKHVFAHARAVRGVLHH